MNLNSDSDTDCESDADDDQMATSSETVDLAVVAAATELLVQENATSPLQ